MSTKCGQLKDGDDMPEAMLDRLGELWKEYFHEVGDESLKKYLEYAKKMFNDTYAYEMRQTGDSCAELFIEAERHAKREHFHYYWLSLVDFLFECGLVSRDCQQNWRATLNTA